MDPFSLPSIVEQIGSWFDRLASRGDRLRQEERTAVKLYLDALTKTKNYIGRTIEKPRTRKRAEEEGLAQLWADAAAAVQSLDPALARVCVDKSEYWSLPAQWRENVDQSRLSVIALGRMTDRAKDLLAATDRRATSSAANRLRAT